MIEFNALANTLAGRIQADAPCPACGPLRSNPKSQLARKLRIWRLSDHAISFYCIRCGEVSGVATEARCEVLTREQRNAMEKRFAEARAEEEAARERKRLLAMRIWRESADSKSTWVEEYLAGRGIALPTCDYLRKRTLRFHPNCPFTNGTRSPALLAAFTLIPTEIPHDPFFDLPVEAVHRIRGRGHDNKAMLGSVAGKAVMLGEWEEVSRGGLLNVAEGLETALKLYGNGHRPIWACGSAGGLETLPILAYARRLVIWADHDESGRGLEAAERLATRYADAGRDVDIFMPENQGVDYGDV